MNRPPPTPIPGEGTGPLRGPGPGFRGTRQAPGWLPRMALALALAVLLAVAPRPISAHDGPEHEIEELTARIEASPDSADLHLQRAIEWAVLGRDTEALRDLHRALRLDPGSLHAQRELARLQFRAGQTTEALATLHKALRLDITDPGDRGGLLVLRAEIHRSLDRPRAALEDCQAALRLHGLNPEWYLLRSDLQRRLGQHRRRVSDLEQGIARTGAGILTVERVEAQLDARRFKAALASIEPELAASRVQCRWLVRRGRARLGLGQRAAGEQDLRAALAEMENLVDRTRPDPTLLLDQATAQMLLGDRDAARRTAALARDKGGHPELASRIDALVRGR